MPPHASSLSVRAVTALTLDEVDLTREQFASKEIVTGGQVLRCPVVLGCSLCPTSYSAASNISCQRDTSAIFLTVTE
jgi:hypothetical protein